MATTRQLLKELQKKVQASSVAAVAEECNVTDKYLYMILNGTRPMSDEVAKGLGYGPDEKRWRKLAIDAGKQEA